MQLISGRERDLGGFSVRRILPHASRRMVGPFIFFDHMGPAVLGPDHAMDVRPHPHINLATVTYLFDGVIEHRDSLGNDELIKPGAINWMTAGHGIVHSERTPAKERAHSLAMNGIQLWVALPIEKEECDPSFSHHPSDTLPEFERNGVKGKLLLGRIFELESPVPVHSDMVYAELRLRAGQRFEMPHEGRELAVYVAEGSVAVGKEQELIGGFTMAIFKEGDNISLRAETDARVMVLGGANIGPRFIEWNFVSSSKERLEAVKKEWLKGPRDESTRFKPIPNDHNEFIPLPNL